MKRSVLILYIFTLIFIISGCDRVDILPENKLTSEVWVFDESDVIYAELSFNADICEATMKISDNKGEMSEIRGVFAVDRENLVITSYNYSISYNFKYKVYEDRLELSYDNSGIIMYVKK